MKKQFLIFIPILIILVIVIYIFFNYKIHNDDKPSRNIKSLNESENQSLSAKFPTSIL